ncbi:MAG: amino acid permease [Parvularculaceae bacterium]
MTPPHPVGLKRTLSPIAVALYGVGAILGAGIYALIGEVAALAGRLAPISFLIAGGVAAMTGLSFAELAARYPKSGGAAIYVSTVFGARRLSIAVGAMVVASGVVSAAVISKAFIGYAQEFVSVPDWAGLIALTAALAALAGWGVNQSVGTAAAITVLEIGALLVVIAAAGLAALSGAPSAAAANSPPAAPSGALVGVLGASVLAFYAFIGFEDMANMAEEVKDVRRSLPMAIIAAIAIAAALYALLAWAAVSAVPVAALGESAAPMAYLFSELTGASPRWMSGVALLAVVNGALVQIIMASRVLYGMSRDGLIGAAFGRLHPKTQTPLTATLGVSLAILIAALALPIATLAELTSFLLLIVFVIVNLALIRVKMRAKSRPRSGFSVPIWAPAIGAASSAGLALVSFVAVFS